MPFKMYHGRGYRVTVPCPLCIWPANPYVPAQACFTVPTGLCPESDLRFSVTSLMTVRSPFLGFPAKPANSFRPQRFELSHTGHEAEAEDRRRDELSPQALRISRHQRSIGVKNKKRRRRTIFTSEQLRRMESEFTRQQYIVGTERQQLAKALNLSETQIKIWFQNRRIKWRKENMQNYPDFLSPLLSCSLSGMRGREIPDEDYALDSTNGH